VAVREKVDAIHSMSLDDRGIFTQKSTETLAISVESTGYIKDVFRDFVLCTPLY
jgi:hypothetical protein